MAQFLCFARLVRSYKCSYDLQVAHRKRLVPLLYRFCAWATWGNSPCLCWCLDLLWVSLPDSDLVAVSLGHSRPISQKTVRTIHNHYLKAPVRSKRSNAFDEVEVASNVRRSSCCLVLSRFSFHERNSIRLLNFWANSCRQKLRPEVLAKRSAFAFSLFQLATALLANHF